MACTYFFSGVSCAIYFFGVVMLEIEVRDLSKYFTNRVRSPGLFGSIKSIFWAKKQEIHAVENISFTINQGELVGYLGPNGAGKSTTIKMLTGILRPSSGKIRIHGIDPVADRRGVARNIGVVFGQKTQLWWDLPLGESYSLLKSIYRIPNAEYKKRLDFFCDLLKMGDFLNQQTRKLSLGQRMRADLAASLIHNPPILFLDEPTIGLDILTRDIVRDFIRNLSKEQKTTILLTTHDIQDIEFLARRLILLDKGKVQYDGNINEFVAHYAQDKIVSIRLEGPIDEQKLLSLGYDVFKRQSDRQFEVRMPVSESNRNVIDKLEAQGSRIEEISGRKQDLAESLKQLYAGSSGVEL